jgi:hypothetical protein
LPSVPMYNRPQVAPNVRRAVNVPTASEGATLAASALGTAADAFQKERERAGRIRVDAAEAEIRGIGARLGDEVSRMQRTQAFGAETMVAERWDTETAKVLSQIADPEVRAAVEARSKVLRGELQARARSHALNQTEVVRQESYEANVKSDVAALASTPLLEAEPILERMGMAARANAIAEGRDEAGIEREVQKIRATGRFAQVNALIANDAADEALAYLDRDDVKKEMQGVVDNDGRTMYDKARTLVERESMDIRAQAIRDDILTRFTNVDDALAAVTAEQKGQMEVRARQYVEQAFADRENRTKRQVQENRNLAIQAINAGGPIPSEVRRFFEATPEGAAAFADLLDFQTKKAKGEDPETEWPLYTELLNEYADSPTKFASKDFSEYINRLSPRHYEEMIKLAAGMRGGQTPRVSPLAVNTFVWEQARKNGVVPESVMGAADLKKGTDTYARFTQFQAAVSGALATALADNPRLTTEEQMAVMQGVVDQQAILRRSFMGVDYGRDTIPASAVRPGDRVVGTLSGRKPMADRVTELRGQGMSKDAIARRMRAEGYGPEMDAVTP